MKQNYKLIIAYDGTRYYGWERQPGTEMTIQGKLRKDCGEFSPGVGCRDGRKGNPQLYEPLPAGGYLRPGSEKSF